MILQLALGIITAIGGFLDAGAIATSALAGALFGYQLIWAVLLGTLCVIVLTEMSGRLAAMSRHTVVDAIRERLGFRYFATPLAAEMLQDVLVLSAEIGGIAMALHLATGFDYRLFILPTALFLWSLLWFGNFSVIENGIAFVGLVALSFAVGMFIVPPSWPDVARSALPSLPTHSRRSSHRVPATTGARGASCCGGSARHLGPRAQAAVHSSSSCRSAPPPRRPSCRPRPTGSACSPTTATRRSRSACTRWSCCARTS